MLNRIIRKLASALAWGLICLWIASASAAFAQIPDDTDSEKSQSTSIQKPKAFSGILGRTGRSL
jgi:hypothetical protein